MELHRYLTYSYILVSCAKFNLDWKNVFFKILGYFSNGDVCISFFFKWPQIEFLLHKLYLSQWNIQLSDALWFLLFNNFHNNMVKIIIIQIILMLLDCKVQCEILCTCMVLMGFCFYGGFNPIIHYIFKQYKFL